MSLAMSSGLILATFALSAWLTRRFTDPASLFHVLDHPNERSLHQRPVPRSGGVAILMALAAGGALIPLASGELPGTLVWIAGTALSLGVISFAEDRFGIQRRYRLLAHALAALSLPVAGLVPAELEVGRDFLYLAPALGLGLTLLFGVWMINLYNFMDGMDGFAGGMAVAGFGALSVAGFTAGEPAYGLANALVAAAATGFLLWNFPPARIFMGDSGSTVLGYLAAASVLWAERDGILPLWASLLIFSPFVVDASVTLVQRLLRGERVWLPHRRHYYQRLVRLGWGHRKTVLRAYLLMLLCAGTALQGARTAGSDPLWLLAMWGVVYGMIAWKVRLMESRQEADRP
jgi:UDP-N-acetylmuramyl pentapeptide phosphotransferase/UDP-N-acetylglucosamine-1-phosphate transferase